MPNHVRNILTVVGPARDIATFVLRSQTPKPPTGDEEGSLNFSQEPQPARVPFDLHGVVPLPDAYRHVPYDTGLHGGPGGYDMEVDTWGVKWGAYAINPAEDIQITEHRATYGFTTPWGPPDRYYQQASLAFPQCTFLVSWGGEGPCLGRARYQSGVCVEVWGAEIVFPTYPEHEDDDAALAAYETAYCEAEGYYLTTHAVWVDEVLAAG